MALNFVIKPSYIFISGPSCVVAFERSQIPERYHKYIVPSKLVPEIKSPHPVDAFEFLILTEHVKINPMSKRYRLRILPKFGIVRLLQTRKPGDRNKIYMNSCKVTGKVYLIEFDGNVVQCKPHKHFFFSQEPGEKYIQTKDQDTLIYDATD